MAARERPRTTSEKRHVDVARETLNMALASEKCEADARVRTGDLLLTMQVLYQLSYVGAASDPSRSRGPT